MRRVVEKHLGQSVGGDGVCQLLREAERRLLRLQTRCGQHRVSAKAADRRCWVTLPDPVAYPVGSLAPSRGRRALNRMAPLIANPKPNPVP